MSTTNAPPFELPPADVVDAAPGTPDPLIGATLAMLTFYARQPNLAAADQITRNFALLARHPNVDARLQAICTRLFLEWLGPLDPQDTAPAEAWITVHDAPATAQ